MRKILTAFLAIAAGLWPGVTLALDAASIPVKVPTYWGTSAPGANITCPMPIPSQISITAGRGSWTDGFPPLTFLPAGAGGVPPFGQDMNGVLCQLSQWTRWYNAGAPVAYDATFQSAIGGYPKGSFVASVAFGNFWLSSVDNNASNPNTGGANWKSVVTAPAPAPGGYLTSQSGVPVISTDSISATQIFWTPKNSGIISFYRPSASAFVSQLSEELTLTLASQHLANTIYDVYVIDDGSGTPVLATGAAWTNSGYGTSSRGSSAIVRSLGFYVNGNVMTMRNGATTYSVAIGTGLYLGTILIDAVAGQVTCHVTVGQSRKWSIWNMYNRAPIELLVSDPASDWTLPPLANWQISNASTLNNMIFVIGAPEEKVYLRLLQVTGAPLVPSVFAEPEIGIAINTPTSGASLLPTNYIGTSGVVGVSATLNVNQIASARMQPVTTVGATRAFPIEKIESGSGSSLMFGAAGVAMEFSSRWGG